jgi:hypothetical protein
VRRKTSRASAEAKDNYTEAQIAMSIADAADVSGAGDGIAQCRRLVPLKIAILLK